MFDKLGNVIVKHPKKIVVIWLAILLASVAVILTTDSNLKYDMTTMSGSDSESSKGSEIIENNFYSSGENSTGIMIVAEFTQEGSGELSGFDVALNDAIESKYPDVTLSIMVEVKPPTETERGVALATLTYPEDMKGSEMVPDIRNIIKDVKNEGDYHGITTYVTGMDAISYDTETGAMEDMKKIDPISILLILILIGLFFRSFVASATPPLAVGAAYGIMTCLIFFIGGVLDIFYITPILLLVSMLGAGCDYCIFVMARFREERKQGKDKEEALRETVRWAGESISTSGLSVIIGFGVMSFCSFSLVSTMGMVLALGIVIALLAALTLIPSILMIIGDRIFYPSTMETYQEESKAMRGWYGNWSRRGQRYFSGSAKHAIKYAKPIVLAAVLITVPLTYVMLSEETSYDMISTMPPGESKDGVDIIVDTVGGGMMMPTYEVVEFDRTIIESINHDTFTLEWIDDAELKGYMDKLTKMDLQFMMLDNVEYDISLATYLAVESYVKMVVDDPSMTIEDVIIALKADPNLGMLNVTILQGLAVIVMDIGEAISELPFLEALGLEAIYDYFAYHMGLVSENGLYTKITVIMKDEPMSGLAMDTIDGMRAVAAENVAGSGGLFVTAWTTGSVALTYDISETVNEEFVYIEIGVVILIFLLLFFVMRSYMTPLRAILTILMSIAWTLGLTHIIFGWILGMDILWIVPIVLLVVCLGLGMDYDILLTTRIRENRLKGMSNDEAITHAVEKSGAVITLCGLIMSGTFFTLLMSSSPMLMQFGFALGFAILIDALVVRTYIVPSIMHLLGDWNWKGPAWLQRGKHKIDFFDKEE